MDRILFRSREIGSSLSVPLICPLRLVRSGASLFHKFHNLPAPLQALYFDTAMFVVFCCYAFLRTRSRVAGVGSGPAGGDDYQLYLLGLYRKYNLHIETTNTTVQC
jgi:hypothetical protein